MKKPTRQDYINLIMQILYFYEQVKRIFPADDLLKLDSAKEAIRYWMQFLPH